MLIDQRIAIIGGTSGIGFAVAEAALDAGAEVFIGSSSQTKIDEALAKFSEKATGSIIDVTEEESVKGFFKSVGEIDHVVVTVGTLSIRAGDRLGTIGKSK